jgi:hypothetical protein
MLGVVSSAVCVLAVSDRVVGLRGVAMVGHEW